MFSSNRSLSCACRSLSSTYKCCHSCHIANIPKSTLPPRVRHDSFMRGIWHIIQHECNMIHSYVWHDTIFSTNNMIHSYVYSYVWHDTIFSMSVIWLIHMCDMTQYSARVYHYAYLYAWHASYACASGHTREWSMSQDILINIQTREFKTQLLHYFSKSDNKCNHHQEFIRINNTHTAS